MIQSERPPVVVWWAFLVLISVYLLFLISFSQPGVDYTRYASADIFGLETLGIYYKKEIISWGLVSFLNNLASGEVRTLYVLVILFSLLFARVFLGRRATLAVGLLLVSPVGILASGNVVRQFLALLFLFAAVYQYSRGARWWYGWLVLAVLSHNSAIFHASGIVLFIMGWRFSHRLNAFHITSVIVVGTVAFFANQILPLLGKVVSDPVGDAYLEQIGYSVYLLSLALVFRLRWGQCEGIFFSRNRQFTHRLTEFLVLYTLSISVSGLPVWAINRVLISGCVIIILINLSSEIKKCHLPVYVIYGTTSIIALFLHDGARAIVGF